MIYEVKPIINDRWFAITYLEFHIICICLLCGVIFLSNECALDVSFFRILVMEFQI